MPSEERSTETDVPSSAFLRSKLSKSAEMVTAHPQIYRLLQTFRINKIYQYVDDLLLRSAADEEFVLDIEGTRIRYSTPDERSKRWFWSKFQDGSVYEGPVVSLLHSCVESGDIVVDIGAHIGYFTLIVSHLVGADGKVLAYEIGPETYELLERNVKYGSLGNVETYQKAVAGYSGVREIGTVGNPTSPNNSLVVKEEVHSGTSMVEATTVDDIANEYGEIDFIKIDVDGAELDVLHGMEDLLSDSTPDIVCEIHSDGPKSLADFGYSVQDLHSYLSTFDIEIYSIEDQREGKLSCRLREVTSPGMISEAIFLTSGITDVGPSVIVE